MKKIITICLILCLFVSGCQSMPEITGSKKTDSAIIGAGVGALAGQIIGGDTKSTVIGGVIGGIAGYVLAPKETKEQAEAIPVAANEVVVSVQNSNDSFTPVVLKKQGTGYIGPRGEYYSTLPTEDQLRLVYGF